MSDWAASGRVKVERAKEHIRDLEAEISAFLETNPYETFPDEDRETGDFLVRLRVHAEPPLRWGAVAGDALHNLRSALDILWRHVMGAVDSDRKTAFPVYPSAEKFEAERSRVVKSRRKTAMDILHAIKPYKGGNDALWALHELDNIDKHRILIPVGSAVGSFKTTFTLGILKAMFPDRWAALEAAFPEITLSVLASEVMIPGFGAYPLKDGAILYRARAAGLSHMDMNPQFTFTIAFGEGEVIQGYPLIPTLEQYAQLVDDIVNQFSRLL